MVKPAPPDPVFARDFLHGFRNRNVMILGWAALPFLIPFGAISFLRGQIMVGVLLVVICVAALINSTAIWRLDRLFIPVWLYYGVVLLALTYALLTQGASASYWAYPACLAILFLADRRQARALILISLVLLVPAGFLTLPLAVAARFAVTLIMVCYFSDLVVGIFTELQARLGDLAVRDPLTGVLNRREMNHFLENAVEELGRGMGPASIVALDIDHFKDINDKHGHEAGDRVLKRLVAVMESRSRRLDGVFRLGGEEFAVVLRNTPLANATCFAESLRRRIEQARLLDGETITVSLGVAQLEPGEDPRSWLRRADAALYEAKALGRNRVHPPAPPAAGDP